MLAKRISNISESQTLAVNTLCQELIGQGKTVYNFSVGEPDITPPASLKTSLSKAFDNGYTKYTSPIGLTEAREKCASYFSKLNTISYSKENIALTSGGKQALFVLFQALLNPGDEVIIIKPYWVSYIEQVKLAGGKPVFVETDSDLQLDVEHIKRALNKNTKAIILNSPCNPTGITFKKERIQELAKLLEGEDVFIVSDDVYQTLAYDEPFYQIASYSDAIKQKTIIIQSFSKSFSMTGLRLGAIIGDPEIIKAVSTFQGHAAGNPSSIIQVAISDIVDNEEAYQKEYINLFNKRRELVDTLLSDVPQISYVKPNGAFYYFIDISAIEKDSTRFARKLLQEKHVALVPGSAFGEEGYVRMSFATSEEKLKKGIELLSEFILSYK